MVFALSNYSCFQLNHMQSLLNNKVILITGSGHAIYASSKTALCAYMRTCSIELAPKNIRCNAVLPGVGETKLINRGDIYR